MKISILQMLLIGTIALSPQYMWGAVTEAEEYCAQGEQALLFDKNYSVALKLFLKAAAMNDSNGNYFLWEYYATKESPDFNMQKALTYLRKAADQGNSRAMRLLASCYLYGRGIPKDPEKAYKLYAQLIAQNNALGFAGMGDMYLLGVYVKKDPQKAFTLYQKAVTLFPESVECKKYNMYLSPNVYLHLGYSYLLGEHNAVNYDQAKKYFEAAVQGRYPTANFELGAMALLGLGCEKNLQEADSYFKKSGLQQEEITKRLDLLKEKLKNKNKKINRRNRCHLSQGDHQQGEIGAICYKIFVTRRSSASNCKEIVGDRLLSKTFRRHG